MAAKKSGSSRKRQPTKGAAPKAVRAAARKADVPIPTSVKYEPDNTRKEKWFAASSRPRKDREGGDYISDHLRNMELTEAELLAYAAQHSLYPVEEIIRRGAISEAKKLVTVRLGAAKVKGGRGIAGARDSEYLAAIRKMEQQGETNITPGKLQLRVERGNIRTAERILRSLGRTWVIRGQGRGAE
jgi:hypothetical protein